MTWHHFVDWVLVFCWLWFAFLAGRAVEREKSLGSFDDSAALGDVEYTESLAADLLGGAR